MTAAPVVLAIDLGTSGPKVAIVDVEGRTLAWSVASVSTRFIGTQGVEQDPEEMWSAVIAATRSALAQWQGNARELRAVSVTSQFMSTIPVAADGTPVGPCILWMDSRGGPDNLELLSPPNVALWLERHGLFPLPSGSDALAKIAVLRRLHPASYSDAVAFVEPMEYVNARLTGRVCATQNTAFSSLTVDNRIWGATERDPDLVAASRVDGDRFPPLVPITGMIGEVTRAAADALGIAAGTPVSAGTIDSVTSAVGTGALAPGDASIIIGTTAVMVSHIDEMRADITSGIMSVPSPVDQRWFVMAENGIGGRALEWFLRSVVYPDDAFTTDAFPDDAFDRVARAIDAVAVGCDGVQFLPWLLGTIAPAPDDDVRAAFVGLDQRHGRAHLVRAILEGVALNLAWLVPAFVDFTRSDIALFRFGGGGAQSDQWAQILADAVGRPVHQLDEGRVTNARGAAFLAFSDLGLLDIADTPLLLRTKAVREPDPRAHALMADGLARLAALHPPLSRHPSVNATASNDNVPELEAP
jgi:xylulokinase